MSQLPWETEVVEETMPRQKTEEVGVLALSADEFSALEERIRRAVGQLKQERQARAEAEERAAKAEAQLHDQTPRVVELEKELGALRTERDHVRQRVERLLAQLDALEL